MLRVIACLSACFVVFAVSGEVTAAGKKGYHCEVTKNGKTKDLDLDEAPNRKVCKKKGGKWVKRHDHDHGDGADHSHDEE